MSNQATAQVTYSHTFLSAGFLNSSACDACGALVVDYSSVADRTPGAGVARIAAPQTNHELHTAFHERLGF